MAVKMKLQLQPIQDNAFLLPIILYADKTTKRTIGQLSYYPIYMSSSCFEVSQINSSESLVSIGYFPVLKAPTVTKNEDNTTVRKKDVGNLINIAIGDLWGKIVDEVEKIYTSGIVVGGSRDNMSSVPTIIVYPVLHYVCGDHPELQEICACSNSSICLKPCRFCLVDNTDLDKFFKDVDMPAYRDYHLIQANKSRWAEMAKTSGNKGRIQSEMKAESLKPHVPYFYGKHFLFAEV